MNQNESLSREEALEMLDLIEKVAALTRMDSRNAYQLFDVADHVSALRTKLSQPQSLGSPKE